MTVTKTCTVCHKDFILGVSGIWNKEPTCDQCAGVVRVDMESMTDVAVDAYEREHGMTMMDVATGETRFISPEEIGELILEKQAMH